MGALRARGAGRTIWPLTEHLASRLHAFVDQGGALVVIHRSGLIAGSEQTLARALRLCLCGNVAVQACLPGSANQHDGRYSALRICLVRRSFPVEGAISGGHSGAARRAPFPAQPRALHQPHADSFRPPHLLRRAGEERPRGFGRLSAGSELLQEWLLDLPARVPTGHRGTASLRRWSKATPR